MTRFKTQMKLDFFWKLVAKKTVVANDEQTTASGKKVEKARLTFLACTNLNEEHKSELWFLDKAGILLFLSITNILKIDR